MSNFNKISSILLILGFSKISNHRNCLLRWLYKFYVMSFFIIMLQRLTSINYSVIWSRKTLDLASLINFFCTLIGLSALYFESIVDPSDLAQINDKFNEIDESLQSNFPIKINLRKLRHFDFKISLFLLSFNVFSAVFLFKSQWPLKVAVIMLFNNICVITFVSGIFHNCWHLNYRMNLIVRYLQKNQRKSKRLNSLLNNIIDNLYEIVNLLNSYFGWKMLYIFSE